MGKDHLLQSSNIPLFHHSTIPFRTDKEPDLHPALSGDEVYTPSPRRSEGWRGQLFARCSNRTTSKTSILTLNEQRNLCTPFIIDTPTPPVVQYVFLVFFQAVFYLLGGGANPCARLRRQLAHTDPRIWSAPRQVQSQAVLPGFKARSPRLKNLRREYRSGF